MLMTELQLGGLFFLIVGLYLACLILTFYMALSGFYLALNPSPLPLLRYLARHWVKVGLTMVPLLLVFWFTASHAALYCRVKRESFSAESGYFFHRMSLFLPACGTVGVWNYGAPPPRSVPALTLGLTPDRVVLHSSLAIYLIFSCFGIAWVGNYLWDHRRWKGNDVVNVGRSTAKTNALD